MIYIQCTHFKGNLMNFYSYVNTTIYRTFLMLLSLQHIKHFYYTALYSFVANLTPTPICFLPLLISFCLLYMYIESYSMYSALWCFLLWYIIPTRVLPFFSIKSTWLSECLHPLQVFKYIVVQNSQICTHFEPALTVLSVLSAKLV